MAQLQEQLTQAEQAQPSAYAPVYYPGTTSASAASTIALGVGEERQGVDFQLLLVPTARVDGTVVSPDGTLPQGVQVALVPADNGGLPTLGLGFGGSMTRVGANGHFEFTDVTPGQYQVEARAAIREAAAAGAAQQPGAGRGRGAFGPISQVLWASNSVAVGGQDVSNLVLSLQPGLTVAGRVEFDGTATPPDDLSRVRVLLRPRGTQTFEIGGTPPGQADVSGRFSIAGVAPGRYTFSASVLPEGAGRGGRAFGLGRGGGAPGQASSPWTLVSAMVDGRDALDFPVDIGPSQNVNAMLTFSDRTQELSGTIQDPSGRPTSDFTIVLFPSDRRYWLPQARRIASSRPTRTAGSPSTRFRPATTG